MDFIRVASRENKDGTREFYPSLQAIESQDLVVRGGQFVGIWDEDAKLYSRRISHMPEIVDRAFIKMIGDKLRTGDTVKKVRNFDNQIYSRIMALIRNIGDMGPELDQHIVFADQTPTKEDAATFKMAYSLSNADCPAWDTIVGTLYAPEERAKIEWAIGSVFTGAAAENIQKFYVFFGPPGSGKSTILNIIEMLFDGHTTAFSAYEMGRADAQFSLEPFSRNPMVAIDQDADLSRIEINKNLNLIVSHDRVHINSKGKNLYPIIPRTCLFLGTNEPVKISNRKSGLFRRLVDIQPTGQLIEEENYHRLMEQVKYELGAIATRCIEVFMNRGETYMSSYRSHDMMYRTNDLFNFVQDNRLILAKGLTLKQAHKMYVEWCADTDTRNIYKQYQFRDLLADYFKEFHQEIMVDGNRYRSYFAELRELEKFSWQGTVPVPPKSWLELDQETSLLDDLLRDQKAQYSTGDEHYPLKQPWAEVTTALADLDTYQEHYVLTPDGHIVIDFDLKDENGAKSLQRNLSAAAHWPPTYAEISRGGNGIHLHYGYDGDIERLSNGAKDGSFEVKTFRGNASLRRKLSLCNNLPVATISSGLPLKEEKVLSQEQMTSEKGLRELIIRNLEKKIHPGTKPSMDFIDKILQDAYKSGMAYDITDMCDDILTFAMGSTNQKSRCLEIAMGLKLKSETEAVTIAEEEKPHVYYDLEVYPNLFVIGWMYDRDDAEVVKMLNPTAAEVEEFIQKTRREGWNNRKYDAHILWAASMGASNEELFIRSTAIINNEQNATFSAAYKIDYADGYDYASTPNKKSLKKWEIDLGLPHMEMDIPWDQPVPDDRVQDVLNYLENDVRSTRATAKHIIADFHARQMLAEMSGLQVINTTRQHAQKIIFGDLPWDTKPDLVYTDLRELFPGYEFDRFKPGKEKSTYKGFNVGEGGFVYAEPGMYENVVLLDVASMHPTSIVEMNCFGPYTEKFKELLDLRLAIKREDFEAAGKMFDGRLKPHLGDEEGAKRLSDALKIVINSIYGYTAATFPNAFKDERNIDNIVAKRGALFMIDLKEFVESKGYKVIHIKTDSVKIPNADANLIHDVMEFGKKYGYTFEHEATYKRFCLVNDAVYVCAKVHQTAEGDPYLKWEATGAQFQHPVVFKTLFSKEEINARDYVEVKQVSKGAMFLVSEESDVRQFIGRFGAFVPVLGGRTLLRIDGDKEYAVSGTKGYTWELDEIALSQEMDVDMTYFQSLVNDAVENIGKFGSYADFTSAIVN